jgi:hypothetical protein
MATVPRTRTGRTSETAKTHWSDPCFEGARQALNDIHR